MAKKFDTTEGPGGAVGSVPPGTAPPTAGPATVAAPPKLRRRPLLALAGLGLVVMGALVAVWVYLSNTETTSAVAVRDTVMRGETVTAADLMTVQVTPDPALQLVPAGDLDSFVGQRAARDLSAGALLTPDGAAEQVVPGADESVVGLALTSGLMPGEPLMVGDRVRVVATPGQAGDPAAFESADTVFGAEVVGVAASVESPHTVVSVLVPEQDAAQIAQWASAGRAALVLDSREGG
ncbi:SAF domain-containing protein [Ornithinimicrobium cerasi]|uniref:SAF domain-containing protein n=1 Tax=Ornithinimicrobium cerasi TaxID=2248773 RepID=A0A285VCB8_9MICO|nr:SAF domain-containing protein [Ornithinimicrobium cerasi]SOC51228.1 SAF domain-containing protein [Ornithinimicrobium cerasi]